MGLDWLLGLCCIVLTDWLIGVIDMICLAMMMDFDDHVLRMTVATVWWTMRMDGGDVCLTVANDGE